MHGTEAGSGWGRRFVLAGLAAFVAVATSLAGLPACAAEDFSKGILDEGKALEAAAAVTREKYPNADYVLVDDFVRIQYRADGTFVRWDDTYQKILTEKGRRENAEMVFHFTLPYETTPTLAGLRIVKPDGTRVAVDVAEQSKVMVDPSQQASNIYDPNDKLLKVGIPGLEIGDVLHYILRGETVKPRVPNTWSDFHLFEYTSPIVRSVYEIHGPAELPLTKIVLKDEVEGTVTHAREEKDGAIVYRWEAQCVPQMFPEPSMPALYNVVQRLLVSTIPSWEYVSTWYWKLSEPHFAVSPEMRATVAKITEGIEDRQKRLEAVFYWVSQNIRYVGITVEKEAPGYEPHDAKMTFDNRHGVCRDKAALLVAMLREAGFEAYPVIIHNGPKKDVEVPNTYFNHAITAVGNPDGGYTLMDATDENTKELFPSYLCDQSYLVARPEGETLLVSPIVPAEENLMLLATRARIDADGNLKGECSLDFQGINDNVYRGYFSQIKPDERRRYFEGALKNRIPGARLTHFALSPENVLDTATPLSAELRFEAKKVLVEGPDTAMLPVPRLGTRVGMVNFLLDRTGLRKREYPLKTEIACGVRETVEIEFDPALGEVTALPEYPSIDDESLTWKQTLETKKTETREDKPAATVLSGTSEFLLKVVEFSPEQYLALKETRKQIEYNGRKMPILARAVAKQQAAADTTILEARVEYDLQDGRNWTRKRFARKRILTYKGKKDNSELRVSFNPVWEEVRIVRATVRNGEEVKEISPEEINLMDADWTGSAPRYPGGKTLVANLPGVEIGSILEYEIAHVCRNRPFFAASEVFRGFDPLEEKSVVVSAPADLEVRVFQSDSLVSGEADESAIEATEEILDGKRVRRWSASGQKARRPEDSLPPWWSFNPTVRTSTGDWKTYARRVELVLMQAAENQPSAAVRAKELLEGLEGPEPRLVAIRDFVAKNIRRAGPGLSALPLSAVTHADQTLRDGYGNSTDQAVLLFAMLRAVALEPEFVLASYAPQLEALRKPLLEAPDPETFDDVLVRVKHEGAFVYLNDTNQYAALGATAHDGHLCIALNTGEYETVRAVDSRRDLSETLYKLDLTAEGDARIQITRLVRGNAFATSHREFAEMPPEERDRYFQEAVAEVSQAAVADGELVTRFDGVYPGVVEFAVKAERYAVRDGEFLYFRLPGTLRNLLGLRSDERQNPLYWASERRSVIRTTVSLPPGFARPVLMPEALRWQAPAKGGELTVEEQYEPAAQAGSGSSGGALTITHTVELDPAVIDAADYGDLLEIHRRLSHDQARMVLLRAN